MLEGFDPEAVSQIRARLDLVRERGVRILFAIESGSRAWGFPSPDSDYDCRFVYVWPVEQHLVLQVQRDVIEFPIEGDIDAGGWDLRKALMLALKGNAVILEWVKSVYVYEQVDGFRTALAEVLAEIVDPLSVSRHYIGLLKKHMFGAADDEIRLKKLFYAIRPALSLRYMEERDFRDLPPMDLPSLLDGVRLEPDLFQLIGSMVEIKKTTREMGTGPVPRLLAEYLAETHKRYDTLVDRIGGANPVPEVERTRIAEAFYRRTVQANSGWSHS
ncbi:MAG: nucleotidyltransferase protein [Rhizobium sp.]|nr:nucleotidyltransferase protein [Rhizobium sp.]